jgi:hypothetical protein
MLRNLSVCMFALVAVLLFSSDASACRRSRGCCGSGYGYYGTSSSCGCGGGYSNGSGMATGATAGTDTTGTATYPSVMPAPAAGVQPGVDVGRQGTNPGGLGGPASGLGVRPGLGVGGAGRGR